MSADLYSTLLRWGAGCGVAKLHGRRVELQSAPVLAGVAVHAVEYVPEIHLVMVQRTAVERWQDMTDQEVAEADKLLRQLLP